MIWFWGFLSAYLWILGGVIMGGFYSNKTGDDSLKSALFVLFTWPISPIYFLLFKQ